MEKILALWFNRKITIYSLFLVIIILAAIGIKNSSFGKGDSSSDIRFTVIIRHFGIGPEQMEKSITIPLEDNVSNIYGIKEIRSTSELNKSRVDIIVNENVDYREFYFQLRDSVDTVYNQLPKTVQRPEIFSSTLNEKAIYVVAFESVILKNNAIRDIIVNEIKPDLETIDGTGEIEIGGGEAKEIHIFVNEKKANLYGMTINNIASQIQQNYINTNIARIEGIRTSTTISLKGRIPTIEKLRNLTIQNSSGEHFELSRIAQVEYNRKEIDTISRIDGEKKIVVYIKSAGTRSLIEVSNALNNKLSEYFSQNPDISNDISFQIIYDYGQQLYLAIKNVLFSIIYSIIAVCFFLAIAFRDLRKILVLALSIPVITGVSVAILEFLHIPLDLGILSGLAIGLGIIADTGIVLVTEINTGKGNIHVVNRLFPSLLASTVTTLIVIIPLFFLPEDAMGITQIATAFIILILVSFILNMLFVPAFYKSDGKKRDKNKLKSRKVIRLFYHVTRFLLKKPYLSLIVSFVLFVLVLLSLIFSPKALQTGMKEHIVFMHVEFNSGTNVDTVDETIALLSSEIGEISGTTLIESIARRDNGTISVKYDPLLISRDYLVAQIEAFNDTLYDSFIYISEGNVDETKLEIAFIGPDEKYLRSRIKEIVQDFQGISMISKTILHFKEGAPVWNFKINHAKASNAGISISDIVNTLRWSLHGPVSVKWKDFNEEEIDLRVMAVRENYNNIDSIKKGTILNGDGKSIGLQELGNFQEIEDRNKIYRLNRQRAAYFSIHTPLKDIDLIYENLNELLNSKEKLPGYRFRIDPKLKQVKEKFLQLQILLIFAVLLIYMVIAAQYESVSTPLVLLLSIPLSVSIPLIVLWLTKQPMTTALLTAMIVVIGLVVNNVILLLDEITTRRQSVNKLTEQEIIFSLRKRILPMLLTTGSTLLGLIPLFLNKSDSSDLLHSLAFIVFWGILGSLFTAIFLIPGLIKTFPALIDRIPDFNKTKKELYNGVQLETANK